MPASDTKLCYVGRSSRWERIRSGGFALSMDSLKNCAKLNNSAGLLLLHATENARLERLDWKLRD